MLDLVRFVPYNLFMEKQKSYLNQYYEMELNWIRSNITIDNATKEQVEKMQTLREKAIKQSGLSIIELSLICSYRIYKLFNKAN